MSHFIEYESWTFPASKIKSGNLHLAASLLSSSLEANSLMAEVEHDDPAILSFTRNSKLTYYAKPERGMVFRVQSIERTAPKLYRISATSTLGILSEGQHYGGIYTGQTAEEIVLDICGTVPARVSDDLKDIKLYGWLPIAAPRDNLSQVLFAIGAALRDDLDGTLLVETLKDEIGWTVGANRMYVESTAKYTAAITSVIVTEHQYARGGAAQVLYEGDAKNGDIITFSEPMYDINSSGFSILESGANYAKLSTGTGTLVGKSYIHNTRDVERRVLEGQTPNIKSVKDATLVSFFNSDGVARRMANFYKWRETIDAPVIYQGEKPGDRANVFHPFDHAEVAACLQSADITLSNTNMAQEKYLVGFVPTQVEDIVYYDDRVVFLEDGTWTVPAGVSVIRVVLIGGGRPGASGTYGDSGEAGRLENTAQGGRGGTGGDGGDGGDIFRVSMDVTPGESFDIRIGAGAKFVQGSSSIPGFTAFIPKDKPQDVRTSLEGSPLPEGFVDPITGEIYGKKGNKGSDGGKGGLASKWSGKYDFTASPGEPAKIGLIPDDPANPYKGGAGGMFNYELGWANYEYVGSGGGGGGAYGESGKDGIGAWTSAGNLVGGNGGAGGKASAPEPTASRGGGGNGGHGGGGGGGGGGCANVYPNSTKIFGRGGSGGAGSSGGDGADGVVLIYYQTQKPAE